MVKRANKNNKEIFKYDIFNPVPRDFVDSIFGSFNYITGECYFKPSKTIMFNFDVKKWNKTLNKRNDMYFL